MMIGNHKSRPFGDRCLELWTLSNVGSHLTGLYPNAAADRSTPIHRVLVSYDRLGNDSMDHWNYSLEKFSRMHEVFVSLCLIWCHAQWSVILEPKKNLLIEYSPHELRKLPSLGFFSLPQLLWLDHLSALASLYNLWNRFHSFQPSVNYWKLGSKIYINQIRVFIPR